MEKGNRQQCYASLQRTEFYIKVKCMHLINVLCRTNLHISFQTGIFFKFCRVKFSSFVESHVHATHVIQLPKKGTRQKRWQYTYGKGNNKNFKIQATHFSLGLTECLGDIFWTTNSAKDVIDSSLLYFPKRKPKYWSNSKGSFLVLKEMPT